MVGNVGRGSGPVRSPFLISRARIHFLTVTAPAEEKEHPPQWPAHDVVVERLKKGCVSTSSPGRFSLPVSSTQRYTTTMAMTPSILMTRQACYTMVWMVRRCHLSTTHSHSHVPSPARNVFFKMTMQPAAPGCDGAVSNSFSSQPCAHMPSVQFIKVDTFCVPNYKRSEFSICVVFSKYLDIVNI